MIKIAIFKLLLFTYIYIKLLIIINYYYFYFVIYIKDKFNITPREFICQANVGKLSILYMYIHTYICIYNFFRIVL